MMNAAQEHVVCRGQSVSHRRWKNCQTLYLTRVDLLRTRLQKLERSVSLSMRLSPSMRYYLAVVNAWGSSPKIVEGWLKGFWKCFLKAIFSMPQSSCHWHNWIAITMQCILKGGYLASRKEN